MAEISIIIPVYNVEHYLNRCVDSIRSQIYSDYDSVLVDDGSLDCSGELCDEYSIINDQITSIHQPNVGLSGARNTGLNYSFDCSDSAWITFIDSDDWCSMDYLLSLITEGKTRGLSLVCGDFIRTSGRDIPFIKEYKFEVFSPTDFYIHNIVNFTSVCSKLYRKELFSNVRFPVGKIHEDEFTSYKLIFQTDQIGFIKKALYAYYCNQRSIMNSKWSPSRLSAIEAKREQVVFFKDNKYEIAEKYARILLIDTIANNILSMQKTQYRYLKPQYMKKLREEIDNNRMLICEYGGLKKASYSAYSCVHPLLASINIHTKTLLRYVKRGPGYCIAKLYNKLQRKDRK